MNTRSGSQVDDIGAIALVNHFQDIGACKILAIVHNTGFRKGIAGVDVINNYYGRGAPKGVRLGAYNGSFGSSSNAQRWQDAYTSTIQNRYPSYINDSFATQTALSAYTQALNAAADNSVVIVSVGHVINLRDLLIANPTLVERKVKQVVFMNGE